ncbi:MAG: hypothetical protein IJR99_15855 [Kiritimatiellae bacterium]|nr:hypothetical protein [Kiritimatiellia bacterium]
MPYERDKNGHLKAGIRLPGWDYCQPWFYMITLTVKNRRPILGKIADGEMVLSPHRRKSRRRLEKPWRRLSRGGTLPMGPSCPNISTASSG